MSLTTSLNIARSALYAAGQQSSVTARNIANANVPGASRKDTATVSLEGGGVRLTQITRAANPALAKNVLNSSSASSSKQAVVDYLDRLDVTSLDPELEASPAAAIQKLADSLQTLSSAPGETILAKATVSRANELALNLNNASAVVQQARQEADTDIATSVTRLNNLLSQFDDLNSRVVEGTQSGADVTDELDERDRVLLNISQEVGIRVNRRTDNDMAIYTDSGVTLFDKVTRGVTFTSSASLPAGTTGEAVYIDGVAVTGDSATMPIKSGRLFGLASVRDDLSVTYQSQLDEIARGLIETFAESDQNATPTLPDITGLFTYSGDPAVPPTGTIYPGLAAEISVNPNVDPAQGGDETLLRDGSIGDPGNPAYVYNTTGASGYSDRLNGLADELSERRSFDLSANLGAAGSVKEIASTSVSWLQNERQTANEDAEFNNVLYERSSEALSNATGVNIDEEMTKLLELERAYQASSQLIRTIDNMFSALLQAAG